MTLGRSLRRGKGGREGEREGGRREGKGGRGGEGREGGREGGEGRGGREGRGEEGEGRERELCTRHITLYQPMTHIYVMVSS